MPAEDGLDPGEHRFDPGSEMTRVRTAPGVRHAGRRVRAPAASEQMAGHSMDVRPSGLSDSEAAPGATHRDMANAIRALAMDAVQKANSGHPGMPMGMADVATVLFGRFLKYQAARPDWPDRDRFVLSAGHGSMLLYALLYLTGYPQMTLEEIKNFRQVGARTAGHPERGLAPGIETTTGPLGQGLANAVGMALAERLLNARFGDEVVDHRTYVIASDGDLMEGISHEAAALAGHLRLGRLIVFFDDNGISIDGPTSLSDSVDHGLRFPVLRLARPDDRRPRPGGHRPRHRAGPGRGPALADRLPHDHRLRRAQQGRQGLVARRAAGQRGDRRRPRDPRLAAPALRGPGTGSRSLARRRTGRGGRGRGLGPAPGGARPGPGAGLRGGHAGRARRGLAGGAGGLQEVGRRRSPQDRDPGLVPEGAGGPGREAAAADRRLGRPDRLERHPDRRAQGGQRRGLHRQLPALRHPRARHGRGHERDGAARRADPLRRFLPGVHRLLPALDPPLGADGAAGGLRHDPRFHRPRRGRPDPSAGRAPGGAAGDPQPQGLPALRQHRDRGGLGAGPQRAGHALGAGAVAPGPADPAHRDLRREPHRLGRLHPVAGGRAAPGDPDRLGLRGRDRPRGPQAAGGGQHLRRGGIDAVLGAVPGTAGALSR